MFSKKLAYIILSYSLFLSWLLSFLYNGNMLTIVFQNLNTATLAMVYIVVPAIACYIFSTLSWKKSFAPLMMKYSLYLVVLGTAILLLENQYLNDWFIYVVSGILGIASVIFIAGWVVLFISEVPVSKMLMVMGITIFFSRLFFAINGTLIAFNLGKIGILFILLCLVLSYFFTINLKIQPVDDELSKKFVINYRTISLLCFIFFFINVGGGLFQTLLEEMSLKVFKGIFIVEVIFSGGIAYGIFKSKLAIDRLLIFIIAIVSVGIGFLILIIFPKSLILSYIVIVLGYLLLDIILWTAVVEFGYLFDKPSQVFFLTMGANLMAVFSGNVLAFFLNNGWRDLYIAISICVIFMLSSLPLFSIVNRELDILLKQYTKKQWVDKRWLDVFTEKEREIVFLMLSGLKNKEIAEKVYISENTLKTHAKNIYSKASVHSKKELIEKYGSSFDELL